MVYFMVVNASYAKDEFTASALPTGYRLAYTISFYLANVLKL